VVSLIITPTSLDYYRKHGILETIYHKAVVGAGRSLLKTIIREENQKQL
jgi:hypothetical protein